MRWTAFIFIAYICCGPAIASVYSCVFEVRCSSLHKDCGSETLDLIADFEGSTIKIINSGLRRDAQVVVDSVMPFRSLALLGGAGAVSILSMHSNLSAVYSYHTGLMGADAIWSSSTGACKEIV